MADVNSTEDTLKFPIVCLGASAGGLEAMQVFFDAMPANSGMAFVVIQHLVPTQESILPALIQRHTAMNVHTITDEIVIQPDQVYVIPAGYEVQVWNGRLKLSVFMSLGGWPETIDDFLKSLAKDQGEKAAVVILSGAGDDGMEGARTIKKNDGLVIAQTPESAIQTSMPISIIEANLADAVLPPELIPEYLVNYFQLNLPQRPKLDDFASVISDDDLQRILVLLHKQTGYYFGEYKFSTLRRQIGRRMGAHQIYSIHDYLNFVRDHPIEGGQLVKSLLINVTNFFRDPEAFESLKTNALMPLLERLTIDTALRVWVPGCAAGQEAISIAILIHEVLRDLNMADMEVRIFATDMNRDLIQQARKGFYPLSIADEISEARRKDYFILSDETYRVRNHISRMIIWSEHNLVENPPFSNLHLISCRNVLIYFQRRLQERIMSLFQFGLRPEGILFLGSSETIPNVSDVFSAIDNKHKIYKRVSGTSAMWLKLDKPVFLKLPDYSKVTMEKPPQSPRNDDDRELEIIKNMLVDHFHMTGLIVDEFYRVRYTFGEIDRYLRIVPGREGQHNILNMAREGLDVELTIALHEAYDGESDKVIVRKGVWVRTNGQERIINLIVKPIHDSVLGDRLKLVIFELTRIGTQLRDEFVEEIQTDDGATITRLREELEQTKKALQSATQALQAKSEELTSSMEEIRSANEEVQTTNEELRTSKEELESMNEELNTLNNQLTDQNYELTRANNTLHNFLQSTEIGMIFLDQHLTIREYTQAITSLFGLRQSDMGRPLAEIATRLTYKELIDDANRVLDTLVNIEKEVYTEDERWYKVEIRPYRTLNNVIDGIVLTFTDITVQKNAQGIAEMTSIYLREFIDTVESSLVELDNDLRVKAVNQAFQNQFNVKNDSVVGQLF